jgi:hypothetical protein
MKSELYGPEVRAKALQALLVLGDALRHEPLEQAWRTSVPQLYPCEIAALELADDDDLALANACLEVEAELRRKEFAAVEGIMGCLPSPTSGEGSLDYRLRKLSMPDFARAASGLIDAGWVDHTEEH